MRKTFVIAVRDYLASVKTKSFLISLILMPVLMFSGVIFARVSEDFEDTAVKRVAIIDRSIGTAVSATDTPLAEVLRDAAEDRNDDIKDEETGAYKKPPYEIESAEVPAEATPEQIDALRFELSERVRKGELFAFVEIGPEVVAFRPTDIAQVVGFLKQLERDAGELELDKKKIGQALQGLAGPAEERAKATVKLQSLFQEADLEPHELAKSPAFRALLQLQDRTGIRYTSQNTTYFDLRSWLSQILTPVIDARRLQTLGGEIDPQRVAPLLQEPQVVPRALAIRGADGAIEYEKDPNMVTSFIIPLVMLFLMFTVLMTAAQPLTMNIIEEKQLRIAEVLLGSVRPFELMLGKLIGGVAISLTLAAIYLGGGLFLANEFEVLDAVRASTIAWFLLFAGLGTLMYGALFVAVGAAVTNLKEAQNLLTPIILLVVLPMVTFGPVHQNPNGTIAKAITYFPLTTPSATVLRLAIPPGIGLGEKIAAAVLSLVTTIALVWLAGRVFRFGMLHTDKAAAIKDMMGWVVRG